MTTSSTDQYAQLVTEQAEQLALELEDIGRRLVLLEGQVRRAAKEADGMPPCNLALVAAND